MAVPAEFDSYFDALRDDVAALGGAKVVGPWFWPEKGVEGARNKLNDALNPERRDRLSDEQERLLMRRAGEARGFSAALVFVCAACGFEAPKVIPPRDRRDVLLREFNDRVQQLQLLGQEIRDLADGAGIRVVKG